MKSAFLVILGVLSLTSPIRAYAQSIEFDKPAKLFALSDLVFVGTVLPSEPTGAEGDRVIVGIATFRLERSWKGRLDREVRVGSDLPFEVGKKCVVAASGAVRLADASVRTASVNGRMPMSDAAASGTLQSIVPVFLVDDIAATIQWYKRSLGFEGEAVPACPPHTFAILSRDDVVIVLQQLAGYQKPDLSISERVAFGVRTCASGESTPCSKPSAALPGGICLPCGCV
jgi:hypothetical protein